MATEAQLNEILDIAEQAEREGDLETARQMMALYEETANAPAPPRPQRAPQISDNPLEVMGGGLDALATLVSGAFATPIAGLTGMVAGPFVEDPAALVEDTQALLTHDPMSQTGQRMIQMAAAPFEKLAEGADTAGQFVMDKTGSPMLAAGTRALIEGAPDILGLKGARAAGAATSAVRRMAPSAEGRLLQSAGVDLKRSQMGSETMKSLDRGSDAVLGDSRFDARQAEQFNRAVLDRADPQGTAAAGKVKVSPDVLRDLKDDVSRAYNDLHARRDTPLDMQLDTDLNARIAEAAADGLDVADPGARRVIAQIESFRALARKNGGRVSGMAGQRIRSKLGELSQSDDGFVATFAREVQEAMDDAWERGAKNSKAFDDIEKMAETRARFRMNLQLERAMQGNATGNVSPAKLYSVADRGANKTAGLHDLARAGKNVLPDSLANSGTAARSADIGKIVGMLQRPGDLLKTLGAAGGGRLLNESPNLGAKTRTALAQPATQLTLAGGAGEAAMDAELRAQEEFLRELGL